MKILHVDDDDDIRVITKMSLELDPGFEVTSAASGPVGLALAVAEAPDVLLLDVMMPEMDGRETLRQMRRRPETAHVPVIFMTARTHNKSVDMLLADGAIGVIPKPFDPTTLAQQIRQHLAQAGVSHVV